MIREQTILGAERLHGDFPCPCSANYCDRHVDAVLVIDAGGEPKRQFLCQACLRRILTRYGFASVIDRLPATSQLPAPPAEVICA